MRETKLEQVYEARTLALVVTYKAVKDNKNTTQKLLSTQTQLRGTIYAPNQNIISIITSVLNHRRG